MSKKVSLTNQEIEWLDAILELLIDDDTTKIRHEYDYEKKQFLYDDIKILTKIRGKIRGKNFIHRNEIGIKDINK